jgi:hypothetical protein
MHAVAPYHGNGTRCRLSGKLISVATATNIANCMSKAQLYVNLCGLIIPIHAHASAPM